MCMLCGACFAITLNDDLFMSYNDGGETLVQLYHCGSDWKDEDVVIVAVGESSG